MASTSVCRVSNLTSAASCLQSRNGHVALLPKTMCMQLPCRKPNLQPHLSTTTCSPLHHGPSHGRGRMAGEGVVARGAADSSMAPGGAVAKPMLPMAKAFYGLFHSSQVMLVPYVLVWFHSLGMTDGQIGVVNAIRPWMAALSMFLMPALADRFGLHKYMAVGCHALSVVIRCSMWFVAAQFSDNLAMVGATLILAEMVQGPVAPIVDSLTVVACTEEGSTYGEARIFGSLGWGLLSVPAGFLITHYGTGAGFIGFALLSCLCTPVLLSLRYPKPPPPAKISAIADSRPPVEEGGVDQTAAMKTLLSDSSTWLFLLQVFLLGAFGPGLIWTYGFLFLKSLGADTTFMGLCLLWNCVAEATFFKNQEKVMKMVTVEQLLNLSLAAIACRHFAYALAPNTWAVLAADSLQVLTFAGGWTACCIKAKQLAPPGLDSTLMGIVTAMYFGIGPGAGALLGGTILGLGLGWSKTWMLCASAVVVMGLATFLLGRVLKGGSGSAQAKLA